MKKMEPTNTAENMVFVEGGTFVMGEIQEKRGLTQSPLCRITLSSYFIGKYEVTQKEFHSVMGFNSLDYTGMGSENNPIEMVSWYDAVMYCNKLSEKEGLSPCYNISNIVKNRNNIVVATVNMIEGNGYRLPTEAEWEYAARGGKKTNGYKYSGSNNVEDVAWYLNNSCRKNEYNNGNRCGTMQVGMKGANELGIYDMSGNVWEWCYDWYSDYKPKEGLNPKGAKNGDYRVLRGGACYSYDYSCFSNHRFYGKPDFIFNILGFRVVR